MNWKRMIGLGVAGNFAGHLEQAGEAVDFQHVAVQEAVQPKAIFPFYVPASAAGFLSTYPLSHDTIQIPFPEANLQIEPEVVVVCRIHYEQQQVFRLDPLQFGAYNDCSIRRPNAKKISEKKNWGAHSKGISSRLFVIDHFSRGGIMDRFRLACYLQRGTDLIEYGIDSPIQGYSYFHEKLLRWIVERMNNQGNEDPVESIALHLKHADYPEYAIISIGATRYTPFGETHYLQKGDRSIVLVYDGVIYQPDQLREMILKNEFPEASISALIQTVI